MFPFYADQIKTLQVHIHLCRLSLHVPRYFIELAYDGSAYHGWQVQPNASSVQDRINHALSLICRTETLCTGCGRTDTGVHASRFYVHFDTNESLEESSFLFRINGILPLDIRVYRLHAVEDSAHARFDAIRRSYSYYITNVNTPFLRNYSWYRYEALDIETMNKAAATCIGRHDFASFGKSGGANTGTECEVMECFWQAYADGVYFQVTANRFLRGMVRAMAGTFLEVSKGVLQPDEISNLIQSGNRSLAGQSVPPQGLFLEEIAYPYLNAGRRRPFNV